MIAGINNKLIKKIGGLSTKELIVYSYGITSIAINKGLIDDKAIDEMMESTKKHAGKLWGGR